MPGERSLRDVIHKALEYGDLSFRDFVEMALYHPELGRYARSGHRTETGYELDEVIEWLAENDVTVTVLGVKGNQVRICVNAPKEIAVHREEIYAVFERNLISHALETIQYGLRREDVAPVAQL